MISIEQTQSQENSTNTEVHTDYDDALFDVPEKPNEKFDQRLYQNAQNYVALNWQQMTAGELDDFSQYSAKLEAGFHNKMAEILELENDPNLSFEDMAEIFREKIEKVPLATLVEVAEVRCFLLRFLD